MGTKRVGLARIEALIENVKRDLALDGATLHGHYLKVESVTASKALTGADSGKFFLVNPTTTTEIDLPSIGQVAKLGWHCTIVLTEDTVGSDTGMNQKVNIDFGSGETVTGMMVETDGNAGDFALENDDYIAAAASASPGDRWDIFVGGTAAESMWFVHGIVKDAGSAPFATGAG